MSTPSLLDNCQQSQHCSELVWVTLSHIETPLWRSSFATFKHEKTILNLARGFTLVVNVAQWGLLSSVAEAARFDKEPESFGEGVPPQDVAGFRFRPIWKPPMKAFVLSESFSMKNLSFSIEWFDIWKLELVAYPNPIVICYSTIQSGLYHKCRIFANFPWLATFQFLSSLIINFGRWWKPTIKE